MKKNTFIKIITLGVVIFGLVACGSGQNKTKKITTQLPKLNEPQILTKEGLVTKIPSQVNTLATHRLEFEGQLSAFLASESVDLDLFVGDTVSLKGQSVIDKMRSIFYIEEIELQKTNRDIFTAVMNKKLYRNTHFSFLYPEKWAYWGVDGSQLYFYEKNDPLQKVIFTFAITNDILEQKLNAEFAGLPAYSSFDENLALKNDAKNYEIAIPSAEHDFLYQLMLSGKENSPDQIKNFTEIAKSLAETLPKRKLLSKNHFAQVNSGLVNFQIKKKAEEAAFAENKKKEEQEEQKEAEKTQIESEGNEKTPLEEISELKNPPDPDLSDKLGKNPFENGKFHAYQSPSGFSAFFPLATWFQSFGLVDDNLAYVGVSTTGALDGIGSSEITIKWQDAATSDAVFKPNLDKKVNEGQSPAGDFYEVTRLGPGGTIFVIRGSIKHQEMMKKIAMGISFPPE